MTRYDNCYGVLGANNVHDTLTLLISLLAIVAWIGANNDHNSHVHELS